jgi:O-antigen/teichoic acid export membrane protein
MQKLISIKKIFTADIFRISFLNAIAVFIKMLTGFVSIKAVAYLLGPLGPMGIAMLGQLNNFTNILLAVSNGGINNGITRYVAEYSGSEKKYQLFLGTGFWITAILSVITGLVLIIGAGYFAQTILKDIQYKAVFYVFGGTIILYAFNTLLISVINGFKEFKKYVIANILGSLTGLLFTIILAVNFGIYGALISAVTYQSVVFLLTLLLVLNTKWFKLKEITRKFSKVAAVKLGHYSLMALVTAIVMPASQLIVRGYISRHISIDDAGLWEGINRVSNMYLMVFATSLSVYYLPRLTELNTPKELRREVFSVYKLVIPLLLVFSVLLFTGRDLIINILFTHEFSGMRDLFTYQVLGDFFKLSSWVLAYMLIAKSMTKTYIIMEFVSSLSQAGLSILFINIYGTTAGATIGYAAGHFIYLVCMLLIFRKIVFLKPGSR